MMHWYFFLLTLSGTQQSPRCLTSTMRNLSSYSLKSSLTLFRKLGWKNSANFLMVIRLGWLRASRVDSSCHPPMEKMPKRFTAWSRDLTTFGCSRSLNAVSSNTNYSTVFDYYKQWLFLTGTTWTSELLWLLKNDCNFEIAAKIPLHGRAPFLE